MRHERPCSKQARPKSRSFLGAWWHLLPALKLRDSLSRMRGARLLALASAEYAMVISLWFPWAGGIGVIAAEVAMNGEG